MFVLYMNGPLNVGLQVILMSCVWDYPDMGHCALCNSLSPDMGQLHTTLILEMIILMLMA